MIFFLLINNYLCCKVHRLVIVDKENRCIGVLSLSDILKFLVLRPLGKCGFRCLFVLFILKGASLRAEIVVCIFVFLCQSLFNFGLFKNS